MIRSVAPLVICSRVTAIDYSFVELSPYFIPMYTAGRMRLTLLLASLRTSSLLFAFILGPILAHAEFVGKVVGVIDGDSIRVMHDGQAEQIRLLGIDCPEKRQPFGTRAKEYSSELAFGQDVMVYGDRRDRYGRRLAEVLLPMVGA
jgi:endonuclease YncB( thermonuclease family)